MPYLHPHDDPEFDPEQYRRGTGMQLLIAGSVIVMGLFGLVFLFEILSSLF